MEKTRCTNETALKQRRDVMDSDVVNSEYSRSTSSSSLEEKREKTYSIYGEKGREAFGKIGSMNSVNIKATLSQLKQSAHERAAGVMPKVE